jgi:hypothetical protein
MPHKIKVIYNVYTIDLNIKLSDEEPVYGR